MFKKKKIIVCLFLCLLFLVSGCSNVSFIRKYGTNITEYKIDMTLNENNTIDASQIVRYKNTSSKILNEVYFHLYPNSFSESAINKPVGTLYETKAYPNGKSYGNIEIKNCLIGNDKCSYSTENVDKDLLKIVLNSSLYPNDFVDFEIKYSIKIPNVLHRFGYGENALNLGNIYPIASVFDGENWDKNPYHSNGDPFYSTLANYSVKITYPKALILAHSGYETSFTESETTKTACINAEAVRDFAMVLSSKFKMISATLNNTEIKYYYYNDEKPDESLETAKKSLATFNNTFGLYPYKTLSVVETNFIQGGMEYPNLVMISDSLNKYDDYTNTIVHEIAHQWWYGLVGNNEYDYGWLDESLTEYSVVIFYEKNPEYSVTRETCIKNAITSFTVFVDVYKDIFNEVDTSMNRKLNEYPTEPEYVYMAYVKGLIMFDQIRNIVGDKNFFNSLKNYCAQFEGKNATPNDLIYVFESTSSKKLKAIFMSFIDGTAIIGKIS